MIVFGISEVWMGVVWFVQRVVFALRGSGNVDFADSPTEIDACVNDWARRDGADRPVDRQGR